MRMKNENRDNWLLIAILVLISLPAVFLFGFMIGSGLNLTDFGTVENLGLWVGAFSTLVIAILTIVLAKETWHLRLGQIREAEELKRRSIRPILELYLKSAPTSFQFLNIHLENTGSGVAKKLTFKFIGESPMNLEMAEKGIIDQILSINFLMNGLASIGVGKERKSYVLSFADIIERYGEDIFDVQISVTMEYEDIEGTEYLSTSLIDFSEFKGVSEIGGGEPLNNIKNEIEKIRKLIEGNQSNLKNKRLNVNAYSLIESEDVIKDIRGPRNERDMSNS